MGLRVTTSRRIGMTVLAWAIGLLIFFPILWTFLTAFKSEAPSIRAASRMSTGISLK